jgi:hypothetical protein
VSTFYISDMLIHLKSYSDDIFIKYSNQALNHGTRHREVN